jgi:hypothetical protein
MKTGYESRKYAESFVSSGELVYLEQSRGFLLKRPTNQNPALFDAAGCYPFFCCSDWNNLQKDFAFLDEDLICISLVTGPFGKFQAANLKKIFADRFFVFKNHYVINYSKNWKASISRHHLRNIKKAAAGAEIEFSIDPSRWLDDWCRLYQHLVDRHGINGLTSFSDPYFQNLLTVPGVEAFRAVRAGKTIGMVLCMVHADIAYYHLGAYSKEGYERRASFVLFDTMLKHYEEKGFRYFGLGAGAGIKTDQTDGLSRFKAGWANDQRLVYFCGKILNHDTYFRLSKLSSNTNSDFFPAYRTGEF